MPSLNRAKPSWGDFVWTVTKSADNTLLAGPSMVSARLSQESRLRLGRGWTSVSHLTRSASNPCLVRSAKHEDGIQCFVPSLNRAKPSWGDFVWTVTKSADNSLFAAAGETTSRNAAKPKEAANTSHPPRNTRQEFIPRHPFVRPLPSVPTP